VTLRLPRNVEPIHFMQMLDEFRVAFAKRLTHRTCQHFGTDDRIILGERLIALDLKFGWSVAQWNGRRWLRPRRHQRVTNSAQHGVIGPDGQRIFAFFSNDSA
jgi:hypothetical protein